MLVLKKDVHEDFEPLETILENSTFYDGDDIYEVFQKDDITESKELDEVESKKRCCCCCWCCYFLFSDFFGFS
jgi:hypothetical protein